MKVVNAFIILLIKFVGVIKRCLLFRKTSSNFNSTTNHTSIVKVLGKNQKTKYICSNSLKKGDLIEISAGQIIPCDGEIIEGMAIIDESAMTGESAPVVREAGGDLSKVTGGTKVVCNTIKVKVTSPLKKEYAEKNEKNNKINNINFEM
ncbi:hypothetical protein [Candidatus Clostridium stratigraminis]|uniref:P-type ATPase A domain-containing protein n=1 Tax=Candidatus Clostridium stratigraminis TaxID=3381661 RepID=A0ABW8T3X0_9CLOT